MTDDVFERRRAHTESIVARLEQSLSREPLGDHTCIYATGSCGRGEMGEGSDLDAYIVRVDGGAAPAEASAGLEAAVEAANAAAGLPPLDGDGKYLKTVSADEVLDLLGEPGDDARGVLTKRMLLLLESRVLAGEAAYGAFIDRVIEAYWQNEERHPHDYLPFVLVNDIVRYWRILLLNHESRLRKKKHDLDRSPPAGDAQQILLGERRYSSYKLRLPRCLTCFSALTYLLALTRREGAHVTKDHVRTMVGLTPLERLGRLSALAGREMGRVDRLLKVYRSYLERTHAGKQALLVRLREDRAVHEALSREGHEFTRTMFELVQELGEGRPLHRHMLV